MAHGRVSPNFVGCDAERAHACDTRASHGAHHPDHRKTIRRDQRVTKLPSHVPIEVLRGSAHDPK